MIWNVVFERILKEDFFSSMFGIFHGDRAEKEKHWSPSFALQFLSHFKGPIPFLTIERSRSATACSSSARAVLPVTRFQSCRVVRRHYSTPLFPALTCTRGRRTREGKVIAILVFPVQDNPRTRCRRPRKENTSASFFFCHPFLCWSSNNIFRHFFLFIFSLYSLYSRVLAVTQMNDF